MKVTLYHGSKGGLVGSIRLGSRNRTKCDFGRGFYMGDTATQPLTLICDDERPVLYTMTLELEGLKVYHFEPDADWAMFVAYNRGRLEKYRKYAFYRRYANIRRDYDVITGKIANDRMFFVMNLFFEGLVGVPALVHALTALNIGNQYCALSQRALSRIEIVREKVYTPQEAQRLRQKQERQRSLGVSRAETICRRERRTGEGFYEVLEKLKKGVAL